MKLKSDLPGSQGKFEFKVQRLTKQTNIALFETAFIIFWILDGRALLAIPY